MSDTLLLGFYRHMIPIPRSIWRRVLISQAKSMGAELDFMSEEHHLIRNYIVRELPRIGEPVSAEYIAAKLGLALDRVNVILDDLEKHMTFLCRYRNQSTNWAYPVTVDNTPHHVTYDSGEQGYAA